MDRETGRRQQGFVLVIVAALLFVLVGFVALGVDVGALYSARTSAQEIADASALAGAFTFINNQLAAQPATATDHAIQVALNNTIMGQPIDAADVTVNVDTVNRRVTVGVVSYQNTYFAKAIWGNTATINVTATAEAASRSTGSSCVKPWFIPNGIFSTTGPCDPLTASQLLIDANGVTTFAEGKRGDVFPLKPNRPADAMAPGQFYAIQLPGSVGGNDYETNISTCANAYLRCGEYYSVETGNMIGPTTHGVDNLIGPNPDTYLEDMPGIYQRTDGSYTDISDQLIVAPVWDYVGIQDFCPDGDFPSGTTVSLKIIGFAVLFLEGTQGTDVNARFISVSACGLTAGGGGTPDPSGGTVLGLPLRLIQPVAGP